MYFALFSTSILAQSYSESWDDAEILKDLKTEYDQLLNSRYTLFPHKGTFLMPYTYNSMTHESLYSGLKDSKNSKDFYKSNEAEFQISFVIPIIRQPSRQGWELLFAYTHHSWWQIYNSDWSRPFRETNYMPELFTRKSFFDRIGKSDFYLAFTDFGYVHQSNGQTQLLSRSWDRIFGRVYLFHSAFMLNLTAWYRMPEARDQDDNHDIYNYMGIGEAEIIKTIGKHTFNIKTPIGSHHLSTDIKYSIPWKDRLRWFFRFQGGYGHSLIEYDRPVQRYGVGIILEEFYDGH